MPCLFTRRPLLALSFALCAAVALPAQQMVTETRDPAQTQDDDFARSAREWTTQPYFTSPLVDYLPKMRRRSGIVRWQNHGEFNMVFNALLNWNDLPAR